MNTKIISAAAAALIALTSAASAGTFYSDSQRDAQLRAQANKVESTGGYVTTPAIDPAFSQRDEQLASKADSEALITTHGGRTVYITKPAIDPAYSQRDQSARGQALGVEAN